LAPLFLLVIFAIFLFLQAYFLFANCVFFVYIWQAENFLQKKLAKM